MKRRTGIFICILITLHVNAQQNTVDSLRQLLATTREDTSKVNLLNRLSWNFIETKPDSNLFYGNQALELSRKIHYTEGEIFALVNTSSGFTLGGNYSKALENSLEAIPYGLKALEIYKKLQDSLNIANELINIGVAYRELNEMDSARYYFNQSLELSLKLKKPDNISAIYLNLGIISLKMKQYDLGISYCRLATPYFIAANNPLFLSSIYNVLGDLFDSTGHRDSAFYYGRLALHHAREMDSPQLLLYSTKQLSALFKESNKLDSAFIYHELAMNAKDSLTSQEKQKQVQALTFNEQLRQMEIEKQKREAVAARKRNLELAGIAIFIPIFLFGILLLGRRKVKSRTVEFLGVLGLLFLFEFIVLFAHPFIGHWTHESPVWMLLILVAVAAILIPLHHRSESWIKKKLASNSKMKLQPETL